MEHNNNQSNSHITVFPLSSCFPERISDNSDSSDKSDVAASQSHHHRSLKGDNGAPNTNSWLQADQLRAMEEQQTTINPRNYHRVVLSPIDEQDYSASGMIQQRSEEAGEKASSSASSNRAVVEGGHAGSIFSAANSDDGSDKAVKWEEQKQQHHQQQHQQHQQQLAELPRYHHHLRPQLSLPGGGRNNNNNDKSTLVSIRHNGQNHLARKRVVMIAIVLVVVVAVAVATARLVASSRQGMGDDSEEPATTDPGGGARYHAQSRDDIPAALQEFLGTTIFRVTDESALSNEDSPQHKAREWLSNEDTQRRTLTTEWRIFQRYAIATLYFATTTTTTNNDHNTTTTTATTTRESSSFLNPITHECTWASIIQCESPSSKLVSVDLSSRELRGRLPSELRLLTNLRSLILDENSLSGTIPEGMLSDLRSLNRFSLSQNRMTGTIPPDLWTMENLRSVFLSENRFTGPIDADSVLQEKRTMRSRRSAFLRQIVIENNQLTGTIPLWMSRLRYLEYLVLSGNQLSGNLHGFAVSSTTPSAMSFMDLSSNSISGTLPDDFFSSQSFPRLQRLYLDHNLLTGPLPPGGQRNFLQQLWLHSNQLEGTIPRTFGTNSIQLKELLLQDNDDLVGTIATCYDWPNIEKLETDCQVDCPCCTECYP